MEEAPPLRPRFLTEDEASNHQTVALASYPRSGQNTFTYLLNIY